MSAIEEQNFKVSLSRLLMGLADIPLEFDCMVKGINIDSREIALGDLFLALPGSKVDGRKFIDHAIAKGAVAILCEKDLDFSQPKFHHLEDKVIPIIPIAELVSKVGIIAARFYEDPSMNLGVIAVTGTNGKTSCTHFLAQTLDALGKRCGIIGTLGWGFYQQLLPIKYNRTTPDAVSLQEQLALLKAQGAKFVAMEVSSHSLIQQRINGVKFTIGVFTNLTRDHLDYHEDMANYAAAKKQLFYQPGMRYAVLNLDDPYAQKWLQELPNDLLLYGYSCKDIVPCVDIPVIQATAIQPNRQGFTLTIKSPWGEGILRSKLLGRFNISNLLATFTTLGILGIPFTDILTQLAMVKNVCGRMQAFGGGKLPRVVVDYAHTPDALEQVLLTLREHCEGKLWCIFGCGGDRDRGKRPIMGRIAERYSDQVILSDDNPRSEEALQIVRDIMAGFLCPWAVEVIHDRSSAIAYAIGAASNHDVILLAGKGHESWQLIGNEKIPYNEIFAVQAALRSRSQQLKHG